jgi:hypothetical protein
MGPDIFWRAVECEVLRMDTYFVGSPNTQSDKDPRFAFLAPPRKKESSMSPHEALVSWREAPTTQISISSGF